MGDELDWEQWVRQELAAPERAALRAHRRSLLGRGVLTAVAVVSAATMVLLLLALLSGRLHGLPKQTHRTPTNGPVHAHW